MRGLPAPSREQAEADLRHALDGVIGQELMFGLDVDGTLVHHDGTMTDVIRRSLQTTAQVHHVVIATGRSLHATLPIVEAAGILTGYAVCSNGAVIARITPEEPEGYKVIHTEQFQPGQALAALHAAAPNAHYAVESVTGEFYATAGFQDASFGVRAHETSIDELMAMEAVRVVVHVPDLSPEEFSRIVQESGVHGVEYAIGWTAWLDMAAPGISKASALTFVADRLKIPHSHVVTMGDGFNDVEMLQWAGVGVAMGQASLGVKEAADATTASVYDDGAQIVLDMLTEPLMSPRSGE